jgi:hypothetical protein
MIKIYEEIKENEGKRRSNEEEARALREKREKEERARQEAIRVEEVRSKREAEAVAAAAA